MRFIQLNYANRNVHTFCLNNLATLDGESQGGTTHLIMTNGDEVEFRKNIEVFSNEIFDVEDGEYQRIEINEDNDKRPQPISHRDLNE